MVNATINGKSVQVPENTTILEAAKLNNITIPHLCYLKHVNEIGACRVCVVEIEGQDRLVSSCNTIIQEGMKVLTNSPKARQARRINTELILSQHNARCAECVRSGNCELQKTANDMGINEFPYHEDLPAFKWNSEFPLIRDAQKCIKCMRCIQVCDNIQAMHVWDIAKSGSRTTVDVTGGKILLKQNVRSAVSV